MKKYIAIYSNGQEAEFSARNIREAKGYAQLYKRHHVSGNVKTIVKLLKY